MKSFRVSIGLINPKSPENVDSILRAAGNFGADAVYYTGQRYPRAVKLNPDTPKLSRKVSQDIPVIGVDCLIQDAPQNMQIICIEFAENATALPEFQHPEQALYIFGPEDGTIEQDVIDRADAVVYVPTTGCMNLAATVNVVLYDRLTKSAQSYEDNELIRQNRDTNNRLKVRAVRG